MNNQNSSFPYSISNQRTLHISPLPWAKVKATEASREHHKLHRNQVELPVRKTTPILVVLNPQLHIKWLIHPLRSVQQ